MNPDQLNEIANSYKTESEELLNQMEGILLQWEDEEYEISNDDINTVFRAIHTIKGTSGMFGYSKIVEFTHVLENYLDEIRNNPSIFDRKLIPALLESKDFIFELVTIFAEGNKPEEERIEKGKSILTHFQTAPSTTKNHSHSEPVSIGESSDLPKRSIAFSHISLQPSPSVFLGGFDPLSFIQFFEKSSTIMNLKIHWDSLVSWKEFDPESHYLRYEILLDSPISKEEILSHLEFLMDGARIGIFTKGSELQEYIRFIEAYSLDPILYLNQCFQLGAITQSEQIHLLEEIQYKTSGFKNTSTLEPTTSSKSPSSKPQPKEEFNALPSIRVDLLKIDNLINRVGELVVSSAALIQQISDNGDTLLQESTNTVSRLITEIREISLKLRMIPIGETFGKFQRIVRDLGKELNKEVQLYIIGGDTEVDKTVIEKVSDPLVHLVRNAIDHGLEDTDTRIKLGKPAKGKIVLQAYHDTGSIVIEVQDDGRGLNSEKIINKALENGLIKKDAILTEEEINRLIFQPGFSTAEHVTNISGRGVGLDVVMKNVLSLRGTLNVQTKPGQGSLFKIRLPLTLAIIDGFLISAGSNYFVLPLDMVLECLEFTSESITEGKQYFPLRGKLLPYIELKSIFESESLSSTRQNIIIVQYEGKQIGIVVDTLYGELQTVIKPLGKLFSHVVGISGSTILGDGKIAFILDVPTLIQYKIEKINESWDDSIQEKSV
jgi:two-component system chemotaxis sensor kinase CheA